MSDLFGTHLRACGATVGKPQTADRRSQAAGRKPLNADLHIAQSDIRPLVRDQLRMLEEEIQAALKRGVSDRMTRIHLEDALARIGWLRVEGSAEESTHA